MYLLYQGCPVLFASQSSEPLDHSCRCWHQVNGQLVAQQDFDLSALEGESLQGSVHVLTGNGGLCVPHKDATALLARTDVPLCRQMCNSAEVRWQPCTS